MFSINPIQINLRHSSSKVLFAALIVACNLDVTVAAVPLGSSYGIMHNFNQGKIKIKGKVVDSKTHEPLASVSVLSGESQKVRRTGVVILRWMLRRVEKYVFN